MGFRYIGICILLMLCSCRSFKARKELQLKKDTIHIERNKLYSEAFLEQRRQEWYQTEKGTKSSMEIFADNVFYWHPDSGLQSKKGNIKVKIRLQQSSGQLSLKHKDSLLANLAGQSNEETAYTSQSFSAISKDTSEKGKGFNKYGQLLVVIMLGIAFLSLLLRLFR